MEISELRKDLAEIEALASKACRTKTKSVLSLAKVELEAKIKELHDKQKTPKPAETKPKSQRYTVEISNYAWDQTNKFVKIFITFEEAEKLPEKAINVNFTDTSVEVNITKDIKDHSFMVNNLLKEIKPVECHFKVKPDLVTVYLKKMEENKQWSHLTKIEKQLADMKSAEFKDDPKDESNVSDSLMNLMKKMYQNGDPEMKRLISKTWAENQAKM